MSKYELFNSFSEEEQNRIKQKYAAARLRYINSYNPDSYRIIYLYEETFGKDILENNNPFMCFVV